MNDQEQRSRATVADTLWDIVMGAFLVLAVATMPPLFPEPPAWEPVARVLMVGVGVISIARGVWRWARRR